VLPATPVRCIGGKPFLTRLSSGSATSTAEPMRLGILGISDDSTKLSTQ
jgi:hypothetical protein